MILRQHQIDAFTEMTAAPKSIRKSDLPLGILAIVLYDLNYFFLSYTVIC